MIFRGGGGVRVGSPNASGGFLPADGSGGDVIAGFTAASAAPEPTGGGDEGAEDGGAEEGGAEDEDAREESAADAPAKVAPFKVGPAAGVDPGAAAAVSLDRDEIPVGLRVRVGAWSVAVVWGSEVTTLVGFGLSADCRSSAACGVTGGADAVRGGGPEAKGSLPLSLAFGGSIRTWPARILGSGPRVFAETTEAGLTPNRRATPDTVSPGAAT